MQASTTSHLFLSCFFFLGISRPKNLVLQALEKKKLNAPHNQEANYNRMDKVLPPKDYDLASLLPLSFRCMCVCVKEIGKTVERLKGNRRKRGKKHTHTNQAPNAMQLKWKQHLIIFFRLKVYRICGIRVWDWYGNNGYYFKWMPTFSLFLFAHCFFFSLFNEHEHDACRLITLKWHTHTQRGRERGDGKKCVVQLQK